MATARFFRAELGATGMAYGETGPVEAPAMDGILPLPRGVDVADEDSGRAPVVPPRRGVEDSDHASRPTLLLLLVLLLPLATLPLPLPLDGTPKDVECAGFDSSLLARRSLAYVGAPNRLPAAADAGAVGVVEPLAPA